jgi:hypothetical protein
MKTIFINLLILLSILTLGGCCTLKSCSYGAMHGAERVHCYDNPNTDERQQCIQEHNEPFNANKYQKTNQ